MFVNAAFVIIMNTRILPPSRQDLPNKHPGYDTNQSEGNAGLWGMQSIPSLPSVPRSLWPGPFRIHRMHLCRGLRRPPTRFPSMTLNNLMPMLQSWRLRECGVSLHCNGSLVIAPDWVLSMGHKELFF